MTVTNVGTYSSLQSLLQNVSLAQNALNTDQEQISSGLVGQTFTGLNGNVEQFVSLGAQVTRLQSFQQSNPLVLSQLQTSNTSLTQIQQLATNLKSLIAGQLSGPESSSAFNQQLLSAQTTLSAQLNVTYGGNYIFGGTNTNTPPVITPVPAPVAIGTADASYYQGSQQDITFRIGDGQVLTNAVRADDPAFQSIFAGIAQAMQANGNTPQLQNAENLIDTGIQGVIAIQTTVNSNILYIQNTNTQGQSLLTYYQGLTQSMSKSDEVALSTKVAQDQTVLEASFQAYARISSLTLSSFLK
jgi:flagellar hook-associated protein 3 FlgL